MAFWKGVRLGSRRRLYFFWRARQTDASERCSELMWVDSSDALWRCSDWCHVLWRFVLWRCCVRRDLLTVLGAVRWKEEVSSVVWRWVAILVVWEWWISFARRPPSRPRCLLPIVEPWLLWCELIGDAVSVGGGVQMKLICASHWRDVVPMIGVVFQALVVIVVFWHQL